MFVCAQIVNAQVQVKFNPSGEKLEEITNFKSSLTTYSPQELLLPKFNLDSILQDDAKRMDLGLPFRYGHQLDVHYSILNSGRWEVHDTVAIWQFKVKSESAYSLSFHFNKFFLPEKANLIIYNEDESFLYGPLTSKQNNESYKFTTGPIRGESIIIQLIVPIKLKEKVQLQINRIIHGYVNILPNNTKSALLNCHNNVACDTAWDDESDAVSKLIMGISLCSGSLVNNTENDYRAFLLTAFHCVDSDNDGDYDGDDYDVDDYVFHFHYKTSSCNGTYANYTEYNSANYLAGWSDSDFALVEMDDSPVGNGEITYLGWDNRNNTLTSGTCIHHPVGDYMKISYDTDSLTTNNQIIDWDFGPDSPVSTHWVAGLDNGAIEGGSSGGPLFNQNSRVVGQLHGGSVQCPPATIYFGQFNVSWEGDNTDSTQLENWLDPNSTGDPTTNILHSPSLEVPDLICYGGHTVYMQNPPDTTITWDGDNVSYPNGNTGTSVTVRAASSSYSGEGTITASFTINSILHTITHPVWVGKPGAIDVYDDPTYFECGEMNIVHVDYGNYSYSDMGVNQVNWSYQGATLSNINDGFTKAYITAGNNEGNGYIYVDVSNTCPGSSGDRAYYEIECFRMMLVITPNPTSGETTVSIKSNTEESGLKSASSEPVLDENIEWELETYSPAQALKEKKTNLKGKSTTIQTHGWKEGVYVVRVKYKDEILTGKLVVKK